MTLGKALRKLIEKYEDGQNHDEGAFDPECVICRTLRDLRNALSEAEKRELLKD